ncbi:MAG: immunoglobulin-like domain-containing protein [Oscillospiraceae bacterium]
MKFGKLFALPVIAALLCGCNGGVNAELLPNASVENSALALYSGSNGAAELTWLFDKAQEQELIDGLEALPVYSGEQVDLSKLSGDIYALSITDSEGFDVGGLWQDGVWITGDGTVYKLDIDFPALKEKYSWKESATLSLADIPNIHYLAKNGGKWNTAYLTKSGEIPESGLEFAIQKVENNIIYTEITNPTEEENAIGLYFSLEVKLDGEWYDIPSEKLMMFNDIALLVPAGGSVEQSYDFGGYGDLPAGDYRVVTDHGAAEFTLG